MSVMITLELPTKAESMAQLLEVMESALVDTRGYAGCQKVETYIDQENQNIFWSNCGERRAPAGLHGLARGNGLYGRGWPLLDGARLLEHSISEAISDGRPEAIMQRKVFRSGPYAELIAQAVQVDNVCICPDKLALMPTVPHLTAWWNKHR